MQKPKVTISMIVVTLLGVIMLLISEGIIGAIVLICTMINAVGMWKSFSSQIRDWFAKS